MKNYYQQTLRALQVAGMSERIQQCYTRSVRILVDFYTLKIRSIKLNLFLLYSYHLIYELLWYILK